MGMFNAADRMADSFGALGAEGWELVALHDKSSNWLTSMEKGFAVFKRAVPDDAEPDGPWGVWQYAKDIGRAPVATRASLGQRPSSLCSAADHSSCTDYENCSCSCHAAVPY